MGYIANKENKQHSLTASECVTQAYLQYHGTELPSLTLFIRDDIPILCESRIRVPPSSSTVYHVHFRLIEYRIYPSLLLYD